MQEETMDKLTELELSLDAASHLDKFFFDRAELYVRSGAGGKGAIAFRGKQAAGANGGRGGSIYLECSASYNTLGHFYGTTSAIADRGEDADMMKTGRSAKDGTLFVPPNVLVVDSETNETIGQLTEPGQRLLVAQGGEGGEGNGDRYARSRTQHDYKTAGPPGGKEKKRLILSMTLVADIGLVGMPNAGKSTLLSTVTKARPKVADYPFTTLIPNLGITLTEPFQLPGEGMVWLDIPGVIEGAASGRGLGLAFLRHAERCRIILHLVDGSSKNPVGNLLAINKEIASFSTYLGDIPQVVLLTKTDLMEPESVEARLQELKAAVNHSRVIAISSFTRHNVRSLLQRSSSLLSQLEAKPRKQRRLQPT